MWREQPDGRQDEQRASDFCVGAKAKFGEYHLNLETLHANIPRVLSNAGMNFAEIDEQLATSVGDGGFGTSS